MAIIGGDYWWSLVVATIGGRVAGCLRAALRLGPAGSRRQRPQHVVCFRHLCGDGLPSAHLSLALSCASPALVLHPGPGSDRAATQRLGAAISVAAVGHRLRTARWPRIVLRRGERSWGRGLSARSWVPRAGSASSRRISAGRPAILRETRRLARLEANFLGDDVEITTLDAEEHATLLRRAPDRGIAGPALTTRPSSAAP